MSRRLLVALAIVGVVGLSPAADAQTSGSVRGSISDAENRAVNGVTVLLTGPALPGGGRQTTSGLNGNYAFPAVPVGDYSVTVDHPDFQSQTTRDIRVGINATATVNFELVLRFSDEVVVAGESPVVDIATSSVGSNYGSEFIKDLPTQRNMWDMVGISPGMSPTSEGSDRQVAFGSNMQSNAWHVDGVDTSAPETGSAWWYINPDTIEEVQVLGIGAPAEFGNLLGAAINVVTKSGTNQLKGSANFYFQDDALTDANVTLPDTPFPEFNRDQYYDATATLGGPLKRDRAWFFAAVEFARDASTTPGVDPAFAPLVTADRYDLKLSSQINQKNSLDLKLHYDDWAFPFAANAFTEPSANGGEVGTNPAGAVSWQSILTDRTLLEVKFAGWWSDDINESQTGSTEPAFIDYSPPGGGPTTFSGGLWYPWEYETWHQQLDTTVSHYTDEFLKGDHYFKFGVKFSRGSAETKVSPSATGVYYYHYAYDYYGYIYDYYYRVEGQSYWYGAHQQSLSAFIDDSWHVGDRLTLNLGVRFDRHEGEIPAFDRLDLLGNPTGEVLPGVDPALTWNNVSPRLGFAYNAGASRKTVIRGSFGVYYDGNVSGNWNYPPPEHPGLFYYPYDPVTGAVGDLAFTWFPGASGIDPDLEAPRTVQYAIGFEREFGAAYSFGAQLVIKDTDNLVGWEILNDGIYEPFPFTDPFTGRQYTLLNEIEPATVRKGNRPGFTANPAATEYFQDYTGLVLTFKKRLTNNFSLMSSYTYSESEGLIPRMLSASQFNPFYGSREGSDPNNYINADQLLQGDRKHMFRAQGNFLLPKNFQLTAVVNLQSGRPYARQIRVFGLNQGSQRVIMEPASDGQRFPFQRLLDVSIGKRFSLGWRDSVLKLDAQFFNILNDDAVEFWQTLELAEGDTFLPDSYVLPRRVMLRVGLEF